MRSTKSVLLAALSILLFALIPQAELKGPENPRWKPMPDAVYLQDSGRIVPTADPLHAAAVFEGTLYLGDAAGVAQLAGDTLQRCNGPQGPVTRLKVLAGALYAATPQGLWEFRDNRWAQRTTQAVSDMCAYRDAVVVASGNALHRLDSTALTPIVEEAKHPIEGVASHSGTIYVRMANDVGLVDDGRINTQDVADWGALPAGCVTRDIWSDGARLLVTTDKGVAVLRGMTWYILQGGNGLPYEDTTCLAPGFDDDLWIGTMRGAIRNVGNSYQYYGYSRWIPADRVYAIAVGNDAAYIATDAGLGIVRFEAYTLRKKAAYYERFLDEWGMKRLGFIHKLKKIDDEWVRYMSDNDIGFSAHYLASKCYEYAVTGDPVARAVAVDMMKTIKWSEEITPVPGFPARSVWVAGEQGSKSMKGSVGRPAEWHPIEGSPFEWKGETSSDEIDAHLHATSLFLELVAEGDERAMATEHISRIFGHIVDNGWFLRDVDGQPTRWGRWDPDYLQRPIGYYARGLNGLEALSYATTAYHFTKEEKFQDGKAQLLSWGYHDEVLRQKMTFHPDYYTDFDDRLAFMAYYPLLRYESDPALRTLWLRSLERSWEIKRIEGLPWYNYIYGVLTGNACENERALIHLRDWPLDLVTWSMFNSHRDDLDTPPAYRSYAERRRAFSPREIGPRRVNRDWTRLDHDGKGLVVEDPATWLEQYWMGRYFGFIQAPTVTDPTLITVPKRDLQLGAAPYTGPARPALHREHLLE